MESWLDVFVLTFVPLFIAIDALGNLPFVIAFSQGMTMHERRHMIHVAIITAAIVGLLFLFFGQFVLNIMGISVGAFSIAGGIILGVISIRDMITGHSIETTREEMIAVVPIGTPLTVGPATIATLLLLLNQFPQWLWIVLLSFVLNLVITWGIFLASEHIVRFLGQGGVRAVSKVFSLLLTAIAVGMVIRGLGLLGIVQPT
ncbi:MAG: MarC family protein [Chloroflexi bacterium]|nr:MarC family protein [Chloroflexota bacterium]